MQIKLTGAEAGPATCMAKLAGDHMQILVRFGGLADLRCTVAASR